MSKIVLKIFKLKFQKARFYSDYKLRWWKLKIEECACHKKRLGGGDH